MAQTLGTVQVAYAELIASTLPEGLEMVNFTVTGSEANEIAMRLDLDVTGKCDMVSLIRGLHGGIFDGA